MKKITTLSARGINGFSFLTRAFALLVFTFLFAAQNADAQLTGTKNVPGDYATLAAAVDAINTLGIGTGGVIINVIAGNPQTAPLKTASGSLAGAAGSGYIISTTTTSASKGILIEGNGNRINAPTTLTSGSISDAIFVIGGTSNVRIDNFQMRDTSTNTTTALATNNMLEFGVAIVRGTSTSVGSKSDTVSNCNIALRNGTTYGNTVGVYSSAWHSYNVAYSTSTANAVGGENSSNVFYSNTITAATNGFLLFGSSGSNDLNNIIGFSGAGNIINLPFNSPPNFTTAANGWDAQGTLLAGQMEGVHVIYNEGVSVGYNTISQTAISSATTPTYGIYFNSSSISGIETATNNTITILGSTATQQYIGIESSAGTAASTFNASNNNITVTNTAGYTSGIYGGIANANVNFLNNSVTLTTTTGTNLPICNQAAVTNCRIFNNIASGTQTGTTGTILYGILNGAASPTVSIDSNSITLSSASTAGGFVLGVYSSTKSTVGLNIIGNAITITGKSNYLMGIRADPAVGNLNKKFSLNTINISNSAASAYGIYYIYDLPAAAATSTYGYIDSNVLSSSGGINTSSTIYGIISQDESPNVLIAGNKTSGTISSTGASPAFLGILSGGGTPGGSVGDTIRNNNFSNINSGAAIFYGIQAEPGTTKPVFINNNVVSNITGTTSAMAGLAIDYFPNTSQFNNNLIENITGQSNVYGIVTESALGTAGTSPFGGSIQGNHILKLSSSGASAVIAGIYNAGGQATEVANISLDTVTNLTATGTSAPTVYGIVTTNGATTNIYQNQIDTLNTAASAGTGAIVNGILVSGCTNVNIYNNNLDSLNTLCTSTTTQVVGMNLTGTATNYTVYNNFISKLTAAASNNPNAVIGVNATATSGSTWNLYFNTIALGFGTAITSSGTNFGAAGVLYPNATTLFKMQDNIINMNVTPKGTGIAACLQRNFAATAGTAPTTAAFSANYNIYQVNSGANNFLYIDDVTGGAGTPKNGFAMTGVVNNVTNNINLDLNFNLCPGLYKAFMGSGRESNTYSENNLVAGASFGTYKPSGGSFAYQNGNTITSPAITTDYAGVTRNNPPCMGALEFSGTVSAAGTPPVISYTPIPSTSYCPSTAPVLTATITSGFGINTTTGTAPRIYYKISTETNAFGGVDNSSFNGWKWVEGVNTGGSTFTFTPNYSLLTATPTTGTTIQYFIIAQDLNSTPDVGFNLVGLAAGYCPVSVALTSGAGPTLASPVINNYTIATLPTFTNSAIPLTVCINNAVTLNLNTSSADLAVQWLADNGSGSFSSISGATTAAYIATPPALSAPPSGTIRYEAQLYCGVTLMTTTAPTSLTDYYPQVLSTTPGSLCGAGAVTLSATGSSGSILQWYSAASGGTPVSTGSSYAPTLSGTTIFYVTDSFGNYGNTQQVGAVNTAIGTTVNAAVVTGFTGDGVNFTVNVPLTIKSVDVFPTGSGRNIAVSIYNSSGTVVGTSGTITSSATLPQTVVLNAYLPVGTYKMAFSTFSALIGATTNTSGFSYPYSANFNTITLNSSSFPAWYMYFYNWQVLAECTSPRVAVTATINTVPATHTLTPTTGGPFCSTAGVVMGMNGSDTGVTYQLYNGAATFGTPVAGTGSPISFNGGATITTPGTYTVIASATIGGCTANMPGGVIINAAPNTYSITPTTGSPFCTGPIIGVSNSDVGISYQLYNGATTFGSAVAGTGAAITFNGGVAITTPGTYTVQATIAGCTSVTMTGNVIISNAPAAFSLTETGSFCAGSGGIVISLASSQVGVNYQLELGGSPVGSPVAGTGSAMTDPFGGAQTAIGIYTVIATNATGCPTVVTSSNSYTIYNIPTAFHVTGTGSYCSGGTGLPVGLDSSEVFVNYTLYYAGVPTDTVVSGTGHPISFGNATLAGIYTVVATNISTTCTNNMLGADTIVINPLPVIASVTSTNPTTCGGTDGTITLTGLTVSTTYAVHYTSGSTPVSVSITTNASGNAIITGLSAGSYSGFYVVSPTSCTSTTISATTTLADPATPVIGAVGSTNPTTCGGSNGNVYFVGLSGLTTYTLHYTSSVSGAVTATITTDAAGNYVITGLTAGTYSGIYVTASTGCTSATVAGPWVLTDPAVPVIGAVGSTNPTTCGGSNGNVYFVGLSGLTTYTLHYMSSVSGAITATIITDAAGNYVITGLTAGTYSGIYVTAPTGCTSATVAGPWVLTDPAIPVITSVTSTNPTTCSGTDGTITLTGLTASTTYTVHYTSGSTPVSVSITTNASGNAVITGLSAGSYSGFYVVSPTSCTSTTISATTTLTDPPTPSIASVTSTNPTTCAGTNGTITLTGLTATTTYSVNYTSGSTPVTTSITTDASGNAVITGLSAGGYSGFSVTSGASCTSAVITATTTLTDPPTPSIASVTSTNPTTCAGTNGTITLTGLTATTTYSVNYTSGSTPVTTSITTDASGNAVITGFSAGGYSGFSVTSGASCTSAVITATTTLTDPPTPSIASVTSTNPTTCAGTNGTITLTGLTATTTYSVHYTSGSTPVTASITTDASGNAVITGLSAGSYSGFSVTTDASCTSAVITATTTLSDPPTPSIASVTSTNPTTCAGADGTITLTGLTATTIYSVHYTSGSTPVTASITTDASGNAVITGLSAGSYSGFSVTSGVGCTSSVISATTTLTDPPTPSIASVTSTNPTTCAGADGTITLTGLTASTTYTVHYTGTTAVTVSITTDASGNAVITGLSAGAYSGFSVTSGVGCTSSVISATTTLIDPPTPSIASVTSTNPTTCAGTDGAITLTGLTASTTYTVHYTSGSTPVTASITTDASGNAVITGLSAGSYSGFSVTSGASCTSAVITATTTLTDPPTPSIASVTSTNPTTCAGTDGTITLTGLTASTTYTVHYTGTTAVTVSITTDASGNAVITGLSAGAYSGFSVTSGVGCTSSVISATTTLTDPPTPSIASVTSTNPTTCAGTDGTITLTGLTATTTYTVHYTGTSAVTVSITTDASGNAVITNLSAGVYSGFSVTSGAGCTSSVISATTTLTDPPTPVIASVISTNPTTCAGTDGTITLTGLTASTTYTVHYIGTTAVTVSMTTDASGNTVITGLSAGAYSGFSVTSGAGCTSSVISATTTLTDPPTPSIASVTSTNPTTCAGTDGTITLTGLTASTTYTVHYTGTTAVTVSITTDASGNAVITGLSAGAYSGFSVTSGVGCTSSVISATTTLIDPPTPSIASVTSTNPTTCAGTDGTITLTGLTASTTYTVHYTGTTAVTVSITTDASSNAVITGLSAGAYSGFSVTSGVGCTSSVISATTTLIDPPTPSIASVTSTNPTTCAGADGTITLTGLSATTSYSVHYTGTTAVTVSITTDASGNAVITGLSAGAYSGFSVTSGVGCTSSVISATTTLIDPPTPSIASVTSTNPTTCAGADGTITLTGLTASTTYTVHYTGTSAVTVSITTDASGNAVITGLSAGAYSGFSVSSGAGCTSSVISATTTLTDPPTPSIASVTSTNPTTCAGTDGTITLTGLTATTTYTVHYTGTSAVMVSITTDASGNAVITGLSAGAYSGFSVTSGVGCTSSVISAITTLTDPPTPGITSVTSTNPTTCSGTDGTITLTGLTASTTYTVHYIGTTAVTVSITTDASGNAVITGLIAGSYSGFSITSGVGCTSAVISATTTLTDPPTPNIASVTSTNPTTCAGTDGIITLTGLSASITYTLHYTGTTAVTVSITTDASGNAVITSLSAGAYSGFSVTTGASCTSAAISATTTLTDPPTPSIASVTSTNPTTCAGTDGTITLTGLIATTTYTVHYTGTTAVTVSITTDASGNAVITGLSAGGYSGFSVTSGVGCTSSVISATTTLTDPPIPSIASVTSTNPTTCSGTDGTITLTGLTALTTYTVHYTGITALTVSITTDASGNAVITGLSAGAYSGFSVSSGAGCTSSVISATTTLTDPPTPSIASVTSTNPTTCSGTDGTITLTGLTALTTYTVHYTGITAVTVSITTDASGNAVITGLSAGAYSGFSVSSGAGCTSSVISSTTTLIDPPTPTAGISGTTTICIGSGATLTFSGTPSATVSYSDGTSTFTASLDGTGSATVSVSPTGTTTYTLLGVTSGVGCPGTASGSATVTVLPTPAVSITSVGTACTGFSTTIHLSGTPGDTVKYTIDAVTQTPIVLDGSGNYDLLTAPLTVSTTYEILSVNNPVCATTIDSSVTVAPTVPGTWIGSISTDWNVGGNWSCGLVPNASVNVTVPSGTPNPEIFSGTFSCGSISVASGEIITIDAGATLSAMGNVTNNASIIGAGTFVLAGSTTQSIDGVGTVSNLTLSNSAGATVLSGMVNITDAFSITTGSMNTNGFLTLLSTATGTGRIGPIPSGSSVTGNVNCQQYFEGGRRAFRFLGHPFSTSIPLSQLEDYIDITGHSSIVGGFTDTYTDSPSAFWFNPLAGDTTTWWGAVAGDTTMPGANNPGWKDFTTTAEGWNQYEGIRVLVRGAKGEGTWVCDTCYVPSSVTTSLTGPINQGGQSIPLSWSLFAPGDTSKFNLISNPYPSPVDLGNVVNNAFVSGDVDGGAFWVWDVNAASQGAYIAQPVGLSYSLQSNVSFEVAAKYGHTDALNFTESDKVNSAATNLLRTTSVSIPLVKLHLYDLSGRTWDMLYVHFMDSATALGNDRYDGVKAGNSALNFYTTTSDGRKLSVDARNFVSGTVIPMGIYTTKPQTFTIKVEDFDIPAGTQLFIHDKYLGVYKELSLGYGYDFTIGADPLSQGDNRLELALAGEPITTGTNTVVSNGIKVVMTPNPATDDVLVNYSFGNNDTKQLRLVDVSGVSVIKMNLGKQASGNVKVPLSGLASGLYLVEITSGSQTVTHRLIKE